MIFTRQILTPSSNKPVKLPPPCPICGELEREVTPGIYRITHDYESHGIARPESRRMPTEDLMGLADSKTLDRLGGQREA